MSGQAIFKPQHLDVLRPHIEQLDTPERRDRYRHGSFLNSDVVLDLNRRYRWDLWWAIPAKVRWDLIDEIGADTKDSHIDTALRALVVDL